VLSRIVKINKVDEVVEYTEPANGMGATLSEVTYTYSPGDVPPWVSNWSVRTAFPTLAAELTPKRQDRIDMVLTNNGWQVAQD
jgi:hypothetical protein